MGVVVSKRDKVINPGVRMTILRSYSKILNTIQSIENISQWDVCFRMVEIFGERFTEDRVMTHIEMMFAKERHNELLSLIRIKYKLLKRN